MSAASCSSNYHRYLPQVETADAHSALPKGRQTPFGWPALRIGPQGVVCHWEDLPSCVTEFRFSIAIDVRSAPVLELVLAKSGYRIGICEVQYGYPLQTFSIPLSEGIATAIPREGLVLRSLRDDMAVWILLGDASADEAATAVRGRRVMATDTEAADSAIWRVPPELSPHLFAASDSSPSDASLWEASFDTLCSPASLQLFGWLEGCVLEGLHELSCRVPAWQQRALQAIDTHLDHFFNAGGMQYVSPRSEPVKDLWNNNEHGLMLPALLRRRPGHPAVQMFCEHWIDYLGEQIIHLQRNLSCEGCYTLAYPLALLSKSHPKGDALLHLALQLLLLHKRYLKEGEDLYLQYNHQHGSRIYPYWLRGVGWYLLGYVRVLAVAQERQYLCAERAEAEQELGAMIRRMVSLQRPDGLWSCFAMEPQAGAETSGSAGVAAAFLLAAELGYSDEGAIAAAKRTHKALALHLSIDGLLSGVSQSNKIEAGEALQRYGYRCRSQMGQGLAVQLAAVLSSFE